jgi:hypothetical protein
VDVFVPLGPDLERQAVARTVARTTCSSPLAAPLGTVSVTLVPDDDQLVMLPDASGVPFHVT